MVSTRRQVINEQDRYGGYENSTKSRIVTDAAEPAQEEIYSGFDSIAVKSTPTQRHNFTVAEPVRRAKAPVQTPAYTETKPSKRSGEEIMPKISPKRVREAKIAPVDETQKLDKAAASSRTKVILGIYLAAVIFLAAVVIITGIAVTNSGNAVSRLESDLAFKNEAVLTYRQELELLSNESHIGGRAAEMGFGKVKSVVEVEISEDVTPVRYESRTNWFDKFCDWLSGILN